MTGGGRKNGEEEGLDRTKTADVGGRFHQVNPTISLSNVDKCDEESFSSKNGSIKSVDQMTDKQTNGWTIVLLTRGHSQGSGEG